MHSEWVPAPASGGRPFHGRYWQCSFVKTTEVRKWLLGWESSEYDEDMCEYDVQWIMRTEGGETGLMKADPASGEDWKIRAGTFVTLAEFFWFGKNLCSCYDIYRAYLSLPIWIQERQHSASTSQHGVVQAQREDGAP